MTKETFQKLLDLYKTLIQLDGNEFMCPQLDFTEEIQALEEVLVDTKTTIDD